MATKAAEKTEVNTTSVIKWFVYGFALMTVLVNVRGIAGFFYSAV